MGQVLSHFVADLKCYLNVILALLINQFNLMFCLKGQLNPLILCRLATMVGAHKHNSDLDFVISPFK